jgi:hypothetical protein
VRSYLRPFDLTGNQKGALPYRGVRLSLSALLVVTPGAALAANLEGADRLDRMVAYVVAHCTGAAGLAFVGHGSDAGEQAMLVANQSIAPMTRGLGAARTCQSATPEKAEGLVVALEATVAVVSDTVAAACQGGLGHTRTVTVTERNGVSGLQCPGCTGADYTFADWRDPLRVLLAGLHHGQSTLAERDCASDVRHALAAEWSSLFEGGCSGNACTEIRRVFRPSDRSGMTELLVPLLGLPAGPSPFCNVRQPSDTWPKPGFAFIGAPSTGPQYPDFQDHDPIRRPCAGSGDLPPLNPGGAPPAGPTEQVCGPMLGGGVGDLGLVLPIDPPPGTGTGAPIPYPVTPCVFGKFVLGDAPRKPGFQFDRCPNGDTPVGIDKCLVPADASGSPQCLNGRNNFPLFRADPQVPASVDGRAYNLALRKDANGALATDSLNRAIIGAFYRIHQTRTLVSPADQNPCLALDAAQAAGCLARASPCSLALGSRPADDVSGSNALAVNGNLPTFTNIRQRFFDPTAPNLYPLSSELSVSSMLGFANVSNSAQYALGSCFGLRPLVEQAAVAAGLVTLAAEPRCADFDERQCGSLLNSNTCQKGVNFCPTVLGYSAAPLQIGAGGHIAVQASAFDSDSPTLTYLWTATSGSFADPSAGSTTFTCSPAGTPTITFTAWDGRCSATATFSVTCL